MARFSRIKTVLTMAETGLIPVFYHPNTDIAKQVLKACYDAGIRVFEFTNRGDFAHEVFAALNKYATRELPEMIMGIGSVVDAPTAALYIQLGANFVVSPLLNEEMARVCNRRKILWSPGCGSVSEISRAEELGAELIKIFPAAQIGGVDFVKAIKGPCPWTSIMPTGGVSPTKESLSRWFAAGVTCVGMGSKLISKELVANGEYEKIKLNVKTCLSMIQVVRKDLRSK